MVITEELIEELGILSKLDISDEGKEQAKKDMSDLVDYVKIIETLDITNVEPTTHMKNNTNVFREDEIKKFPNTDSIMREGPDVKGEYFKVPNTF